MKLNKKYFVVVFFVFWGLIIGIVGPNLSFIYNKKVINKEIKRQIRENLIDGNFEILEIPIVKYNDKYFFKWIHSAEFKYNDKMYDIIDGNKTLRTDSSIIFYVVNDTKEEQLLKEFVLSDKAKPYSILIKKMKLISLEVFESEYQENILTEFAYNFFPYYKSKVLSLKFDLLDPPPKTY
ncbi:hypothetical protein MASR1M45_29010 [Candidatus Kapaibacterium sp.]